MDEKEKEYRKVFFEMKKWAKAPSASTYTRGYTAGNGDVLPAGKVYECITTLQKNSSIAAKEKLHLLSEFIKGDELIFKNIYCRNMIGYIEDGLKKVENNDPIRTKRL